MHAFNYTIITYGYFSLRSWNKDHCVQDKLANPFIYNFIPKGTFLLEKKAIESLKIVQKCAFSPCVNKHSYLTKELEYRHEAKVFELLT